MVFSSATFLFFFLPIFLAAYYFLPKKNLVLLIASLFFYTWGEPVYIALMVSVVFVNYLFGIAVTTSHPVRKKAALVAGVIFNISVLVYFKYSGFFIENLNELLGRLHIEHIEFSPPALPLGISFFIFQAVTYVVDIYRRHAKVEYNPLNVALYVSMFPQLVAGPIVRFEEVSKAIHKRVTSISHIITGIERFIIGLAKKVLIADPLSIPVEAIFAARAESLPIETAWFGAVCFGLQIYFDFSAYSDMAIGLGRMLGFKFPENFNYPYRARTVQEFWRRWHMTLSRWFRDYVYIPLGGNRLTTSRTYINLLGVFFLTGIWHGSSWSFIVWGLFHGLFMTLERLGVDRLIGRFPRPAQNLYLLIVVTVSWVYFRAEDISHANTYIASMFGVGTADPQLHDINHYLSPYVLLVFFTGILVSVNPVARYYRKLLRTVMHNNFEYQHSRKLFLSGRGVFYISLLSMSLASMAANTHQAFIYFRF